MGICESKNDQNNIQNPAHSQVMQSMKTQESINNNRITPNINNTPIQYGNANGIFVSKPGNNISEQERKNIDAQLAQFLADFDQPSNKEKHPSIGPL